MGPWRLGRRAAEHGPGQHHCSRPASSDGPWRPAPCAMRSSGPPADRVAWSSWWASPGSASLGWHTPQRRTLKVAACASSADGRYRPLLPSPTGRSPRRCVRPPALVPPPTHRSSSPSGPSSACSFPSGGGTIHGSRTPSSPSPRQCCGSCGSWPRTEDASSCWRMCTGPTRRRSGSSSTSSTTWSANASCAWSPRETKTVPPGWSWHGPFRPGVSRCSSRCPVSASKRWPRWSARVSTPAPCRQRSWTLRRAPMACRSWWRSFWPWR